MIITIDGPAGTGKSSVARILSERLGFKILDTGAMYRAVTWKALREGVDLTDQPAVADIASRIEIEFIGEDVFVDGSNVTSEIRGKVVTDGVSDVADNVDVREQLVMLQRELASAGDYVCEGRDQGTVAFPNADCKIFLTASPQARAERRLQQLRSTGQDTDFDTVLAEQQIRDHRDETRLVGRLYCPADAVVVNTDDKTQIQVVSELEFIVRSKIPT